MTCTARPTRSPGRRRRGHADLPGRHAAVPRLRGPELRASTPSCTARSTPGSTSRCAPPARFDEARALTAGIAAAADRRPRHATCAPCSTRRSGGSTTRSSARWPSPPTSPTATWTSRALWDSYRKPGHQVIDGGRAEVGGITFGFVGAGLVSPYRTPNEMPRVGVRGQAGGAVRRAGRRPVHAHTARRPRAAVRRGGPAAGDRQRPRCSTLIRRTQPRYALFGHVHQPLARRVRIGRTECVNVGHFRATRAPFVVDL